MDALLSEWRDWKIKNVQEMADDQQLQELLQAKKQGGEWGGWTFLHYACLFIDIQSLKFIKSKLNSKQIFQALNATTDESYSTPLFYISEARDNWFQDGFAFISNLLQPFDNQQVFKLMNTRNKYGTTVLHYFACIGHKQIMNTILSMLTPGEQLELLRLATEKELFYTTTEHAGYYKPSNCLRILEDFKLRATIGSFEMPVTQHPQTKRQGNHRYMIPIDDGKPTKHAFIMYNPEDRVGAHGEAESLGASLQAANISTQTIIWSSTTELASNLYEQIEDIKSSCTLLVVCIMAHGSIGCLQGSDRSTIPLNDILKQITQSISLNIGLPMIAMVQACQGFQGLMGSQRSSLSDMARRVNPLDNKHIVLMRPDTVLLMATVTGGEAIRGAYTGAIAEQIRKADGKTDIHEMHTQAVNQMMKNGKQAGNTQQIPEYRDTLMGKKLILPKPPKILRIHNI